MLQLSHRMVGGYAEKVSNARLACAKPLPIVVDHTLSSRNRSSDRVVKASKHDADMRIAPASARSVQRVAYLAGAWSEISRRLACPFEQEERLILSSLKLSLSHLEHAPARLDGRLPSERAVQLASKLAELSSAGLPLGAEPLAAAIVLEACEQGHLDHQTIEQKLGTEVSLLVHDVLRVRTAPQRVELYNDIAASSIREWCLAFHDVRASAVEVVCRWDELQHMGHLPLYEQQLLALEALQVYAPLGHALGLGPISSAIEDTCFRVLFPQSYHHTHSWLCNMLDEAEEALFKCQQELLMALDTNPAFSALASSCMIRARTKSLFSIMKKLLRLGNMSEGGRRREEIYDILGMRAIVIPRSDLPPEEAELAACKACYVVQEIAESMWPPVCDRTKDYISTPKPNGYKSLHLTLNLDAQRMAIRPPEGCGCVPQELHMQLDTKFQAPRSGGEGASSSALLSPFLELQIRTKTMDEHAECGDAAHTAYKGGLDSQQARQLQIWTQELQNRLAGGKQAKLVLPAGGEHDRSCRKQVEEPCPVASRQNSVDALFRCLDKDSTGRVTLDDLHSLLTELLPKSAVLPKRAGRALRQPPGHINSIIDVESGSFRDSPEDLPDAESLLLHLQSLGDDADAEGEGEAPLFSEGNGEKGMTLPEFARFLKKIVLLNALSRLDRASMGQLKSE